MSFDYDCAKLIQRYLSEVDGKQYSLESILKRPRWRRVWFWWKALEYYEGKPMPDFSLDEVKTIYGYD